MHRIGDVPRVLIHGRLGVSSPLKTALKLYPAWPKSEFVAVGDEGHGGEAMIDEVVRAITRFAPTP